jgi:hypothetical protein
VSDPHPTIPFVPQFPKISTSFVDDSQKKAHQMPFMKFLIKLLHIFTMSAPFSDDTQKGTLQQQQQQQQQTAHHGNTSNKNDVKLFNVPPIAYTTAMIFFLQLVSVIFVLNIEEFSSPLVMFSYWRNKIS